MCGIVGYVGPRNTVDVLLDGLQRLEYRGYDSAGVALVTDKDIDVRRKKGKLADLAESLNGESIAASTGIGHTRWATHGAPTDENAHPHRVGRIAVVHNGIIENYRELKKELKEKGRTFSSQTDSEILAHLVDQELEKTSDLATAVRKALEQVQGTYALGVLSQDEPDLLIVARHGSPLVMGSGKNENFIASDIPAILPYTRKVTFLEDGEIGIVSSDHVEIQDFEGKKKTRSPSIVTWSPAQAEKWGYRHFMLKEIFEQPRALVDTLAGAISSESNGQGSPDTPLLVGTPLTPEDFQKFSKIVAIGCGTSWHACLLGQYIIEKVCRFPVEVDRASEFRYRDPLVGPDTLGIFVSQSGETADTLAALREAKKRGVRTLGICNVVESTIAREADSVMYTHAGPEIGVASTKAFTTQIAAFYLLAQWIAALKGTDEETLQTLRTDLRKAPQWVETAIEMASENVEEIARKHVHRGGFLFLGRGLQHPIALEGALKLKEISYIHAEGYPAGEMKHGPIALIDDGMPVVILAPRNETYEKILSNMEEVKARGGHIIAVAQEGDTQMAKLAHDVLFIPETPDLLSPLISIIPLQLLAYHIAVLKGTDIDQPRNLAKSVTVE